VSELKTPVSECCRTELAEFGRASMSGAVRACNAVCILAMSSSCANCDKQSDSPAYLRFQHKQQQWR